MGLIFTIDFDVKMNYVSLSKKKKPKKQTRWRRGRLCFCSCLRENFIYVLLEIIKILVFILTEYNQNNTKTGYISITIMIWICQAMSRGYMLRVIFKIIVNCPEGSLKIMVISAGTKSSIACPCSHQRGL